MVSLTNREWCAFFCFCWTLIIFLFVAVIQYYYEINNVYRPPPELTSRADYVKVPLDQQAIFLAPEPIYDSNNVDLLMDPNVSTDNLDDFINQLQLAATLVNVAEAVERFMSIITTFDGVIEIFFKLLPHDSDYEKMLVQFNTVYEKIDALTDKMEEIEKKILIAIDWRPYKDQRHMVLAVSESFDSMAKNPNDSTFQMKFIESCKANRMDDRLEWLEREMNRTYADSMVYSLGSEFHLDFFLSRSADVLTTATKAAFLLGACLRKEQEKEDISDGYIKTEKAISNEKVQSIVKSIRDGESTIKREYFEYLKGEINAKTDAAGAMPHDQFAKSLFNFISDKYNWRTWFVASYNGNTYGWVEHAIFAGGSASTTRHTNRMVFVATTQDSTKPSDGDLIKKKFSYCLRPRYFTPNREDDCLLLAKELDACMRTPDIFSVSVNVTSMLACVKFGNGIRAVYNSPTAFFNNIGAVKCNGLAPFPKSGMSIVDEALVDCWLDQGPCTPDMYDVDLNTDLGKCIAYAWVDRYEGNADYSMMIVV